MAKQSTAKNSAPVDDDDDGLTEGAASTAVEEEEEEEFGEDQGDEAGIVEYDDDIENQEKPPVLPEGTYVAEIIDAPVVNSKSREGGKYWNVALRINPDQYPQDFVGDEDGEVLYFRRLSTDKRPKSRWRLKKFLETIGAPLGKRINSGDWVGRTCRVVVAHEEFNDEINAVAKSITA